MRRAGGWPVIGRVAAVDYGRRRVGLAVSDALGLTCRGLPTHRRPDGEPPQEAGRRVAALLAEVGVERVVVGLPLHADGRASPMSEEARVFGDALAAALGKPVTYLDEGLSSWAAEDDLRREGRRLEEARRAGAVDQRVALGLLRAYLDALERRAAPGLASDPEGAGPGAGGGDDRGA